MKINKQMQIIKSISGWYPSSFLMQAAENTDKKMRMVRDKSKIY